MLGQHQRWPVAPFQPQLVPDHERVGLGGQRNQPEDRFAGRTFNSLASDHAAQFLPRGKAIADRDDSILPVVALKQLLLRGCDRGQNRCWIGGCRTPRFSYVIEQRRMQTGITQIGGRMAEIGQCLPQIRSCHMRQLERNTVEIGRVSVGDPTRDQQFAIDGTRPGDGHGAIRSRVYEERSSGQLCPDLQIFGGGIDEHRGFGTEAPRLQLGPPCIAVAAFGEEHRR